MPSSKSWVLLREDKNAGKTAKNGVPKSGFGDRQVGAFSVFRPRHTGGPFIFWRKTRFFQKSGQFRGWCNITPKSRHRAGGVVYLRQTAIINPSWLFMSLLYQR